MNFSSHTRIVLIVVLSFCIAKCTSQCHDLIVGNYGAPNNEPIITQVIHKENTGMFKYWSKVEKVFVFPDSFGNNRSITSIVVKDQRKDGKGGYAKILKGGVNQYFVEIRLKSQSGGDIDFVITIYAEKRYNGFDRPQVPYPVGPVYPNQQWYGPVPAPVNPMPYPVPGWNRAIR